MALRSMLGLTEPHTFELADQRLATVMAQGDARREADRATAVLYASVNEARKATPFELEPLRARWAAEQGWGSRVQPAMWGLPVPAGVTELPQRDSDYPVRIEQWEYGMIAEILHEGSRAEEGKAVDRLKRFVESEGLQIVGPYEEEYLTAPGAPVPKTLIRFRVKRA